MDWESKAACKGEDPALWFPASGPAREAKGICARCHVQVRCLDGAVQARISDGIWGGVGADRRTWLAAVRAAVPHVVWRRVLQREALEVRRFVGLDVGPVPIEPQRECWRCGEVVPAGRHPVDRAGPNASCGIVSTYNRGCRCLPCTTAKRTAERAGRRNPLGGRVEPPPPSSRQEPPMGTVTDLIPEGAVIEGDDPTAPEMPEQELTAEERQVIEQVWELTEPPDMSIFETRRLNLDGIQLDWSTAARIGAFVHRLEGGHQFWFGDWANAVDAVYGEKLWQLIDGDTLPFDEKTVANWQHVCARIPPAERADDIRPSLRWSHYRYVADLDDPAQRSAVLDRAETEGLTANQVQDICRALKGGTGLDEAVEDSDPELAATGTWTISWTLHRDHVDWGHRYQGEIERLLTGWCARDGIEPTKVTPSKSGAATTG